MWLYFRIIVTFYSIFENIVYVLAANVQNKRNENQTTRSKMEQLKSIMEERKEKRKEKRFSPYEKRFPSLNLISSTTPVSRASAAAMHAPKSNDSLDAETTSIHSKPVIA